jgi:hypothetical protein
MDVHVVLDTTFFFMVITMIMLTKLLTGLVSPLLGQPSNYSRTITVFWNFILPLAGT